MNVIIKINVSGENFTSYHKFDDQLIAVDELSKLLQELVYKIKASHTLELGDYMSIRDTNGKNVGSFEIVEE